MKFLVSFLVCVCFVSVAYGASWHNSKDNEIGHKPSLGDVYLDRVYDECTATKNAIKCFKYRALKYIHQMTTADPKANTTLWGPIGIEAIPASENASPLFFDSQPRAADSEFDQMSKYAYRQLERFVTTHALTWTPTGAPDGARFIDTENEDVDIDTEEGRSKKKKKEKQIKMLLPLIMFFKLKVLLKLILIKVIFIKKMLIIGGALLLPTILSQKIMKLKEVISTPVHHSSHDHGWSDGGGGHSSYSGGGGDSYKQYGRMNKRAAHDVTEQENAAQDMAYQAYVYKV